MSSKGFTALIAVMVICICSWSPKTPTYAADPAAICQRDGGIYVYLQNYGAPVAEGCTHGATGYARIQELTSMEATASGFICRIAGIPADKPCEVNSSTNIYWTYWWWRDGSWFYATIGGSYAGIPGSVEAWNYSPGELPSITPPPPAPPEGTGNNGNNGSSSDQVDDNAQPGAAPITTQTQNGGQAINTQPEDDKRDGKSATADASAESSMSQSSAHTPSASASPSARSASSSATPKAVVTGSDRGVPIAVWVALGVGVVVAIGGGIYAFRISRHTPYSS